MTGLTPSQKLRIQKRHKFSIDYFGYQPAALYWSSAEVQITRFKILSDFIRQQQIQNSEQLHQAWCILDVGCGFGELKGYLTDAGFNLNYTGIDVSPEMVQSAGFRFPGIDVREGEIFDFDFAPKSFDIVMLSGALNEVVDDTGDYARNVILKMYQLSRYGAAFNLLDKNNSWIASRHDLQSFYPQEILQFCQSFCPTAQLIQGYLDNDFSVYLPKLAHTQT